MIKYFVCSVVVGLSLSQSAGAQTRSSQPASQANKDPEVQKLELEKIRVEGDLRLREKEIQLRRDELQAKQQSEKKQ